MIKNKKGVTLVSLIITIALMAIISTTTVTVSMDRFEINKFNKMKTDIELLLDKVSNYYLKYGVLPILRNGTNNTSITYPKRELDFVNQDTTTQYYILDLEAMEGISLNYGKSGFNYWKNYAQNINNDDEEAKKDIYIISSDTHNVYYVKGMKLKDRVYHYAKANNGLEDTIPPSTPQIKLVSGIQNNKGIYTTEVELEIVPGKEDGNVVKKTEISTDNGGTWTNINRLANNIYKITSTGEHLVQVRSYDKNDNISENSMELSLEIRERKKLTAYSENQSWLELSRSLDGTVSKFRIYGNSVQNGEPTIEAPIEIESVGEKTKNLVKIPDIDSSTPTTTISCNLTKPFYVSCQEYPSSIKNDSGVDSSVWRLSFNYLDGSTKYIVDDTLKQKNDPENGFYRASEENPVVSITYRSIYIKEGTYKRIQVEYVGTEIVATDYEPYGYKIPVKVNGKNLFDINKITMGTNYNGINNWYGRNYFKKENDVISVYMGANSDALYLYDSTLYFSAGTTITISADVAIFKQNHTLENNDILFRIHKKGVSNGRIEQVVTLDSRDKYYRKSATFTITEDGEYLIGLLPFRGTIGSSNTDVRFKNIQIEQSSTPTEYEEYRGQTSYIYLNEPLRKIGQYADYIDFENNKVVRKVKEVTLTGDEDWFYTSEFNAFGIANASFKAGQTPLCTHFKGIISGINSNDKSLLVNNSAVYITRWDLNGNVELFKTFLESENVKFINPLATPAEETIELPELATFNEYTKIEVLTGGVPSKIEAEYSGYEIK